MLVEVCSNRGDVKRNYENITALVMRAFYFCLLWVTAMNTHARTATEASEGATSIQVATVDSKSAVLLGVLFYVKASIQLTIRLFYSV